MEARGPRPARGCGGPTAGRRRRLDELVNVLQRGESPGRQRTFAARSVAAGSNGGYRGPKRPGMSACRHHLDSRAAPMQVSPYSGRRAARFCSSSKESSPRAVGGLITSRSGVTCRGSPSILPILGHALMISRSATPADADLGAVLMNDQLLIVVIVLGLQIAFVAIARAFPAILGAALVKTIEHRYAVRLSRLKADLDSRYTTFQTSVNFLAANQSELRSKTITAVQTLWTSILAIEQEFRELVVVDDSLLQNEKNERFASSDPFRKYLSDYRDLATIGPKLKRLAELTPEGDRLLSGELLWLRFSTFSRAYGRMCWLTQTSMEKGTHVDWRTDKHMNATLCAILPVDVLEEIKKMQLGGFRKATGRLKAEFLKEAIRVMSGSQQVAESLSDLQSTLLAEQQKLQENEGGLPGGNGGERCSRRRPGDERGAAAQPRASPRSDWEPHLVELLRPRPSSAERGAADPPRVRGRTPGLPPRGVTGWLNVNRAQVWAEALHRYRAGEPHHLPHEDTDENYLAVCQARETGENGLRLDAVGNFISSTVLVPLYRRPACQRAQRRAGTGRPAAPAAEADQGRRGPRGKRDPRDG